MLFVMKAVLLYGAHAFQIISIYFCVLGRGPLAVCLMHLRGPGRGWGVVVVSAAALLLLAALGLALALILTRESLLQ